MGWFLCKCINFGPREMSHLAVDSLAFFLYVRVYRARPEKNVSMNCAVRLTLSMLHGLAVSLAWIDISNQSIWSKVLP